MEESLVIIALTDNIIILIAIHRHYLNRTTLLVDVIFLGTKTKIVAFLALTNQLSNASKFNLNLKYNHN